MVTVVVIVVVVEIVVMGVGAVVDDTVEVVVVELQPMPSNNSRTSLPVSAQATTRSRSPCVSNMSYTGAPAKECILFSPLCFTVTFTTSCTAVGTIS